MRVCYITMLFPKDSETFAANDVRALRRAGIDVSVHSLRPAQFDSERLLMERGLENVSVSYNTVSSTLRGMSIGLCHPTIVLGVIAWVVRHTWWRPSHLLRSLLLVPRSLDILLAIERQQPDVLHLFWGHYPAIVGYLVRKRMPQVVLSMFLGAYDLTWRYGGSSPVARQAAVIWTHARENVRAIEKLGVPRERIWVAHRGVDLAKFGARDAAKIKQRIVSAGRLIRDKATHDVLAVFGKILRRWPNASLVVLGDGPERSRLESLAAGAGVQHAVTFLGHVAQDVVSDEMAVAQVFISMSKKESERLPNVVKEAMLSRCVCIVTQTPGIGELVQEGVTGYVVPNGDVEAAASRIDWVFRNHSETDVLLHAAYEHVSREFDVNRTMRLYREHWMRLVRARDGNQTLGSGPSRGPKGM